MTNSEVIEILQEIYPSKKEIATGEYPQVADAIDIAIEAIQENTKLKAEIEQLKRLSNQQSELNIEQFKQIDNHYQEIEQLKAELEQSVKLPCKVGDKIWWLNGKIVMESEVVSFCIDEDGVSIIHIKYLHDKEKDRWYGYNLDILNIGKTIFLTQEEAEQSLKGQV